MKAVDAPDLVLDVRNKCESCDYDKTRTMALDRYISVEELQEWYIKMVNMFSDHEHTTSISNKIYPGFVIHDEREERKEEA